VAIALSGDFRPQFREGNKPPKPCTDAEQAELLLG
jgi:hypothetical protein